MGQYGGPEGPGGTGFGGSFYNQGYNPTSGGGSGYGSSGGYGQQPPQQHQQQAPPLQQPASRGPPPVPAPAPTNEWMKYETDQGIPYWYNTRTNTTQWENPASGN